MSSFVTNHTKCLSLARKCMVVSCIKMIGELMAPLSVGTILMMEERKRAKQIFEPDDEKKLVTLTMIEGSRFEEFNTFIVKIQVKNEGENKIVSWTAEYEKKNENIEDDAILF
ncbi:hypothetical protein Leryth_024071 [Lithospermum erythrorhizon]|nr:hypothetical protein Leryth_024071 [Lithospermum erythrorhizon]